MDFTRDVLHLNSSHEQGVSDERRVAAPREILHADERNFLFAGLPHHCLQELLKFFWMDH